MDFFFKFNKNYNLFILYKALLQINNNFKKNINILLDFSKKQFFLTKTDIIIRKTIITLSNNVILKKNKKTDVENKKSFSLKNEFLFFFFNDLLNIKNNDVKKILFIKGCVFDILFFFQKLEKLRFINGFNNIIINYNNNYNLKKKKRIRSIKKRLKKTFLKIENKNLKIKL